MKLGTAVILWCGAGAAVSAIVAPMLIRATGDAAPVSVVAVVLVLLLTLPLGWMLNQDTDRLRRTVARTGERGPVTTPSLSPFLKPVAAPMWMALEQSLSESDSIHARVREMEIQCRLIDSERARLEEVLESLQDAVLVTNPFGEIKLANPVARALLGIQFAVDRGRSVDLVIGDSTVRRLLQAAHQAGNAGYRQRSEVELGCEGGGDDSPAARMRAYEATLACLPDQKEQIGGVVLILRDISREREISQMKSEFVSKASHELRTPLSSINAYVEMLLDGEAADEKSKCEFYQIIKNEADRLGRLIDNMLNISRIEAGIVKAKYEDVDFVKAAESAVEVIEPQARLKDITIRVKAGPLLYSAEADRDMVHQAYLNLLSNAIKYTPEGGRVTVTVENDETTSSVMVTVADTGLGIPPDSLSRIFEKFYRIENYKRVAKGTGLGLNLVKHIVETVHSGRITVESELGLGSRFIFAVPYTRALARGVAA